MKSDPGYDLVIQVLSVANVMVKESHRLFRPHGLSDAQFNIPQCTRAGAGRPEPAGLERGAGGRPLEYHRSARPHGGKRVVQRADHPSDRRVYLVTLTAAGRKLWQRRCCPNTSRRCARSRPACRQRFEAGAGHAAASRNRHARMGSGRGGPGGAGGAISPMKPEEKLAEWSSRLGCRRTSSPRPNATPCSPGTRCPRVGHIASSPSSRCWAGRCCVVGISLIIKSNWEQIGDWVKIVGLVVLLTGSYALGYRLKVAPGRYPRTGDACLMAGAVLFLLGIALVSQIFHIDSRPANGVLLWWAASLCCLGCCTRAACRWSA